MLELPAQGFELTPHAGAVVARQAADVEGDHERVAASLDAADVGRQAGRDERRVLAALPLGEDQVGKGILWGEEHTDFNLLTLLPGGRFLDPEGKPCARPDDASGLFLRTRPTPEHPRGQLVEGRAPAGCIVAQVGQELEILTGGEVLATPHVITAPKVWMLARTTGHYATMEQSLRLEAWMEAALKSGRAPVGIPLPTLPPVP